MLLLVSVNFCVHRVLIRVVLEAEGAAGVYKILQTKGEAFEYNKAVIEVSYTLQVVHAFTPTSIVRLRAWVKVKQTSLIDVWIVEGEDQTGSIDTVREAPFSTSAVRQEGKM